MNNSPDGSIGAGGLPEAEGMLVYLCSSLLTNAGELAMVMLSLMGEIDVNNGS
jgi:hypothetical protein